MQMQMSPDSISSLSSLESRGQDRAGRFGQLLLSRFGSQVCRANREEEEEEDAAISRLVVVVVVVVVANERDRPLVDRPLKELSSFAFARFCFSPGASIARCQFLPVALSLSQFGFQRATLAKVKPSQLASRRPNCRAPT